MKRRWLAILLALAMTLSLLPAAALAEGEEAAGAAEQLYAYWVGRWVQGGDRGELIDHGDYALKGDWGDNWGVLFYTDVDGTNMVPGDSVITFVPDDGTAADAIQVTLNNNGCWNLGYTALGSGVIRTTVEGVTYEATVVSELPYMGFSSAPTMSADSYLADRTFTYTDTNRTFYFVLEPNSGDQISDVSGCGDLQYAISAVNGNEGKLVTFTIPTDVDFEGELEITLTMTNPYGQSTWTSRESIQLVSTSRRIVAQSDYRDYGTFYETEDGTYDVGTTLEIGYETGRVFYIRDNGAFDLAQKYSVSSSNEAVMTVEKLGTAANTGNPIWNIRAVGFGSADVVLTFDSGEVMTYPVSVVVPGLSWATDTVLNESTYVPDRPVHYSDEQYVFYAVYQNTNNAFDTFVLSPDYAQYADALTVEFTPGSSYAKVTLDPSAAKLDGAYIEFLHTGSWNGRICMNLESAAPRMVYRWVGGNRENLTEEVDDNHPTTATLNPNNSHWMVFCLRSGDSVTPLENVTSVVSSDTSVASVEYLGVTDQGNPAYEIHGVDFGSAVITVTYGDGDTLTMPVDVVLPERGWSSAATLTQDSYVADEFVYSDSASTIYYVFTGGTISSFGLMEAYSQYADCFDITLADDGSYVAVTVREDASLVELWVRFEGTFNWSSGGSWTGRAGLWFINSSAPTLGAPSELQWNVEYDRDDNVRTRMGAVGFRRGDPDQARYDVEYYLVGESKPAAKGSWGYGSTNDQKYFDMSEFIYQDLPSGEYYFRIRTRGDGVNYGDGEWVTSDTWVYTAPDAQLTAPSGLTWGERNDEITMNWEPAADAGYYELEMYYAETEDGEKENMSGYFDIRAEEDPWEILWEEDIAEYGNGWYFFKVRAISADITQIRNSDWSEFSPGFFLGDVVAAVNGALDNIDPTTATTADIQAAVGDIAHLDEALAADTTNDSTVAKIAGLEQTMGATTIDTTGAPANFTAEDVKVTGAVMNAGADATLTISAVDGTNAPAELNPAQYNNTIQFAMDIPQAVDTDDTEIGLQLAVPVKITLPIPAQINPTFLVVLHYKESTGTWEELSWPHVYQENGKWYATFVVDSMSPFALAQRQVTASVVDGQVLVSAYLPTAGKDMKFLCAVYSAEGKMLGMAALEPHSAEPVAVAVSEISEGMYLKVISADAGDGWVPLADAQEIPLLSEAQ